ncbi:Clp protease ClpP [Clostridium sp. MB40-C1]|uniref:head maturation protease, ClpP-related n=1 Tax=Clostridium sp. MB40-C1 TaxID=3070996 RepID=UPI0027DF233F|nr:head maturation protease, ClpP-related [Clostridium sp. MB40-C1]WMJ81967.1 Clp protease ClpP [Clostridium sp. MB40-C1]
MDDIKIPKIQTKLQVNNSTEKDTAEMYLYGTIRKAYWWESDDDCISANRIKNVLAELKDKDINIHLNSPGGDVFESIAICNLLKQHSGNITIIIDALAASGGSVICMGANKVIMLSNSMMMIHKAWTIASGNADDLRKNANDLDKMDNAVLASYKSRFVGTDEELKALIKESSWFTADECKSLGFCDEILDEQQDLEPQEDIKNSILNKYMNKSKEPQWDPKPKPKVVANKNKQAIQNLFKKLGGVQ